MTDQAQKRKSLGRGLEALLGENVFDEKKQPQTTPQRVDINLLCASKFQPRSDFNKEALNALCDSIKEKGILQPILVRPISNDNYEIIAGERRYRAAKLAGVKEVPIIIKQMDDKEVLEVALVENLLRENLSAIEEAEGLQRLISEFSHTQDALSKIIGKSRSYIANTLRLLSLPQSIQQMVRDKKLTAGHVRPLIGVDNAEKIAQKIIKKDLNVRQVEALLKKNKPQTVKKVDKTRKNSDIKDIEENINHRTGIKIKITQSKKGNGKVTLLYNDISELDKIIDILNR